MPHVTNKNYISSSIRLNFAPSAGFINAIQFNDKFGLEANANLGFNLLVSFLGYTDGNYRQDAVIVQPGLMFNPCVKFRYKSFAIGLDIAVIYAAPTNYRVVDSNGDSWGNVADANTLYTIGVTVGKVF